MLFDNVRIGDFVEKVPRSPVGSFARNAYDRPERWKVTEVTAKRFRVEIGWNEYINEPMFEWFRRSDGRSIGTRLITFVKPIVRGNPMKRRFHVFRDRVHGGRYVDSAHAQDRHEAKHIVARRYGMREGDLSVRPGRFEYVSATRYRESNPAKLERCVREVRRKGVRSAWGVCTAAIMKHGRAHGRK